MFKPLRFNDLLKAIPGLDHLQLTPQAQHKRTTSQSHAHQTEQKHVEKSSVKEKIDARQVQRTAHGVKETHVHGSVVKKVEVETHPGHKRVEVRKELVEDIEVRKVQRRLDVPDGEVSETLEHVHATHFEVAELEMTPPHPPRESTPIYMATHHRLVNKLDTPCAICGVRKSTLHIKKENPFGAIDIETHHYPVERSLLNACDPKRIHVIFPQVKDKASLEAFIDSEDNMMVLCDIHHRHPHYGIHHLLAQDFFIQPFLYGGYQVVADVDEASKVRVANEHVIARHHV